MTDLPDRSRQGDGESRSRVQAALARHADVPAGLPPRKRRPEDTSEGCLARARDDRERAVAMGADRMRFRLQRSAEVWSARADLLARLERGRTAD